MEERPKEGGEATATEEAPPKKEFYDYENLLIEPLGHEEPAFLTYEEGERWEKAFKKPKHFFRHILITAPIPPANPYSADSSVEISKVNPQTSHTPDEVTKIEKDLQPHSLESLSKPDKLST